mmetsp:Transcript_7912/g.12118  ORF Transcript_7912/g.12118 Transcript_7912/m.12118 type:complete len:266 (+) Transcript_7912:88-885(+)
MKCLDATVVWKAEEKVKAFYDQHTEIKESHGWEHIQSVLGHTNKALSSLKSTLPSRIMIEIKLAALLHDLDDKKYFPDTRNGEFPNANNILEALGISPWKHKKSHEQIMKMISWVSCSENGNSVPNEVMKNEAYYMLIPRWADRLEAVGRRGVVRCYQYNQETSRPLFTNASPRPQSEEELWSKYAVPSKLQDYVDRGGKSTDMISHYYDKLLHIAKPPKDAVRNPYLEREAESTSRELVEICLRFGKTGRVDEEYILQLMETLK